jgi:hypothetical protein
MKNIFRFLDDKKKESKKGRIQVDTKMTRL